MSKLIICLAGRMIPTTKSASARYPWFTRLGSRAGLSLLALSTFMPAHAEPSFSYKYKTDCSLCHTAYPRLNRTGYLFRRLGYRFPREVEQRLQRQATTAVTPQNVPPVNRVDPSAGRQLFENLRCGTCHSVGESERRVAPALDGVGARKSLDYITTQIKRPRDHNPASIMPSFSLSADQMQQLTSYLESLPAGSEATPRRFDPLDYIGLTYIPAIRLSQSGGNTDANYDTRSLILFLAGPLGDHLSMFVESNPADVLPGFQGKWDTAQGVLNFGNSTDFFQTRFGQLITMQGNGFGATDRFFSDTYPLIYSIVNGFAGARFGRGASSEYTVGMSTTLKVFAANEADGSTVFGGVWEQVIGKQGLSGFSVQLADGWNPGLRSGSGRDLHFQRWYFSGNKAFQDKRGVERLNLLAGFSFVNDNQLLGGVPNRVSHGYGSFVEADAFPVFRHISPYARLDQLRPSTQNSRSMKAGTFGVAIDVTPYTRLLLGYQRFVAGAPFNFYTIGFRLNL